MHWTQIQSMNWDPPSCRRKWQLTPVFLFGKSYGQRSLVGCSLWGGNPKYQNPDFEGNCEAQAPLHSALVLPFFQTHLDFKGNWSNVAPVSHRCWTHQMGFTQSICYFSFFFFILISPSFSFFFLLLLINILLTCIDRKCFGCFTFWPARALPRLPWWLTW